MSEVQRSEAEQKLISIQNKLTLTFVTGILSSVLSLAIALQGYQLHWMSVVGVVVGYFVFIVYIVKFSREYWEQFQIVVEERGLTEELNKFVNNDNILEESVVEAMNGFHDLKRFSLLNKNEQIDEVDEVDEVVVPLAETRGHLHRHAYKYIRVSGLKLRKFMNQKVVRKRTR